MQSNLTSVGTKLSESSSQLTGLSQKLTTLQTQLKQVPLALDGGVQAITELETGLETVKQGLDQRGNTQSTMGLIQASQTLNSGLQQIQTGLNAYTSGVSQAQSGTQTLVNNSAALNSGSGQLSSGLSQMNSQVPTLTSGVNQLANGTQTLANNSGQLTSGATQLASGSGELQSALSSGSAKINSIHPNAQTAAMFAAPSTLNHQSYSHVSNYGHALAPYVLSVALYVGCLVFNFVYPIRKISMTGHSPKEWFASKVVVSGLVAIGMAVIETALMMAAGLNADHPAQMFLIATIFSLASMYVIMFFSMAFDNPGRFVAMVLLMLQLGGSGGTFPMEVTNSFFNAIHPWLPMTYSILGFRQALTSGIGNQVIWQVTGVLLIFAIAGLICLLLSMIVLQKMHWQGKSQLDNNQKLQDVEK
jgi:YhgE/Pip C-terminal domain